MDSSNNRPSPASPSEAPLPPGVAASRAAAVLASAAGILIRLLEYLNNRSLWLDEAHIALRIIGPRFWEILADGRYVQTMPVGIVVLERLIVQTFGPGEYSLRALPLGAGIGAIVLMWRLSKRVCSVAAWPLAVALFAITRPLIYYSTEVKQYSTDVFITIGIYLAATSRWGALRMSRPVFLALAGAAVVWFSHPAILVLGAVVSVYTFQRAIEGNWRRMNAALGVGAVWIASFLMFFVLTVRKVARAEGLVGQWAGYGSFPPIEHGPLIGLYWLFDRIGEVFRVSIGGEFVWACAAVSALGCVSLWQRGHRPMLAALLAPAFFAGLLSIARLYAFNDRLLLFIAPAVTLLAAEGLVWIYDRGRHYRPAAIVAAALVFYSPAIQLARAFRRPALREEIKPVLKAIESRWDADSWIYVYYSAIPAVRYYFQTRDYALEKVKVWNGARSRADLRRYETDVNEAVLGKTRMWFVFTHAIEQEQRLILDQAARLGVFVSSAAAHGASGWLFDFTRFHEQARNDRR